MPKPRATAREQRRLARSIATADAIACLDELAESPSPLIPLDAAPAYRLTIARYRKWLVRADSSLARRSERRRKARARQAESAPDGA